MQGQSIGKKQLGYWVMYAMNYEVPDFEVVVKTFTR